MYTQKLTERGLLSEERARRGGALLLRTYWVRRDDLAR